MMYTRRIVELNLRLFDGDGGGAPAGGGTPDGGQPDGGAAQGAEAKPSKRTTGRRGKNELAKVQYGKAPAGESDQPPAAELEGQQEKQPANKSTDTFATADTNEAKAAKFEELIKGDYKDLFDQRVQGIIDSRFKQTKGLESRLESFNPLLDTLATKYGADPSDIDSIIKAVQEDDSFFEDAALKAGMPVDQYKKLRQTEAELQRMKDSALRNKAEEESRQIAQRWIQESEGAKQIYPDFDFKAEREHPETGKRFMDLLRVGIPVQTAYEVIHKDDIFGGVARHAAKTAQKQVTETIKARGMRPAENGASGQAAATLRKADPKTWTKADRREISKRVQRGEKIFL